jgi:acetyl esterase/lipase
VDTLIAAAMLIVAAAEQTAPSVRVETNVVYGMYSGLALLMDVYRPARPNGYGIIHISGSGYSAPLSLDAAPLKASPHVRIEGMPLVEAGYTVFTINHRALPRFQHPAQIEDAQRAVRFVRYHAKEYGIDSDRIGAIGGSSGGHLVSMLGVLDGRGDPEDPSPVNRMSAKVQAVVARATPADLRLQKGAVPALLLGAGWSDDPTSAEQKRYVLASAISHVSRDDPPFLLIHGDKDETVPMVQSEQFATALKDAGVSVRLIRIPGAGHGPNTINAASAPETVDQIVRWFDLHLKRNATEQPRHD